MHPDWLIRPNFRLRVSDNLHADSLQNSWISKSRKCSNVVEKLDVNKGCISKCFRHIDKAFNLSKQLILGAPLGAAGSIACVAGVIGEGERERGRPSYAPLPRLRRPRRLYEVGLRDLSSLKVYLDHSGKEVFKINTAASRSAWFKIVETQNIKFMATRKERKARNQFKNQYEGSVCSTPFVLLRATYSRRVLLVKEETT